MTVLVNPAIVLPIIGSALLLALVAESQDLACVNGPLFTENNVSLE